ncbi:MAG: DUF2283 domain-containing protein [Acidimicrobiales bacterium]
MRYRYDQDSDALYVYVTDGEVDHTEELVDGVILDVGADGSLAGIDVMVPSGGWDPSPIAERFQLSSPDSAFLSSLSQQATFVPGVNERPNLPAGARNVEVQQGPAPVYASA